MKGRHVRVGLFAEHTGIAPPVGQTRRPKRSQKTNTDITNLLRSRHTLLFTREFTRGNLVGIQHADSLGFCDAVSCERWVCAVNAQNAAGHLDYKILRYSVVVRDCVKTPKTCVKCRAAILASDVQLAPNEDERCRACSDP